MTYTTRFRALIKGLKKSTIRLLRSAVEGHCEQQNRQTEKLSTNKTFNGSENATEKKR